MNINWKQYSWKIIVFLVLIICFNLILVTDLVPWFRGLMPFLPETAAWEWLYALPRLVPLMALIGGLVVYLGVGRFLVQEESDANKVPIRLILLSFCGSTLFALLAMSIEGGPLYLLFTRTASILNGGFLHGSTLITNFNATLRQWPQFMQQYFAEFTLGSTPTSPPGLHTLFVGAQAILNHIPILRDSLAQVVRPLECQNLQIMSWSNAQLASAWMQMAMPLGAALAVAPLYKLGSMVFDRTTARYAVLL